MSLLQCIDLHYAAGTKTLFAGLDFAVDEGERVGLCGHNGCGKSTLLRLLAGQLDADAGLVQRRRNLRLAYVEQFLPEALARRTLLDAVIDATPDGAAHRAREVLAQLGFGAADEHIEVGALSGGQQNRLMVARAVAGEPELVLFDEPTNHLDLATLQVLEAFLRDELRAAFVLVSHDRALLDAVTERTVILRDARSYSFDTGYSAARSALAERDIAAAAARRAEEQEIDALKRSAKRLANWGKVYDNEKMARRAKSMEKRVERLEGERTFVSAGSGLSLSLEVRESRARRALRVADTTIGTAGGVRTLFRIDELVLRPGERVALLGRNGVGKSTFIRLLMQAARGQPQPGVTFSPQAQVGYYDQELAELDTGQTFAGYLRARTEADEATRRAALIRAGFAYRDHDRRIAVASGGERARLQFVRLQLERPNFLILDEPTNHIDIDGKEALEEQLLESKATVLVTAHDRRFVDRVCERFLWIDRGALRSLESPEPFYEQLARDQTGGPAIRTTRPAANSDLGATSLDEEQLLARIVELEALIAADQQRKEKHQKPALRASWQRELAELQQRLI